MADTLTTDPQWELAAISEKGAAFSKMATHRLKVPGGWIYRVMDTNIMYSHPVALVFVPEVSE